MSSLSPEDVGSDFRQNEEQYPENKSSRSRRPKACKQCHALKVRCIPLDESDPNSTCVRCLNAKKVCEIETFEPKKRRKKAPAKAENLAELKNQIAALQSEVRYLRSRPASGQPESLSNNGQAVDPSPGLTSDSSSPPFMTKTDLEKELGLLGGTDLSLKAISDEIRDYTTMRENTLKDEGPIDAISLNIIDLASARQRLHDYRTKIYPMHSYVKIPDDVTVEGLVKTSPFLFNSVMAISPIVRKTDPEVVQCLALDKHAIATVTREILVNGSKSVELVKCLILLSVWYNAPEFFKARRYHILNQLAVTLLYDLGLVTRQAFTYSGETKVIKRAESSFDDIEYRVLILTLYCSTVGFCLILRRAIYVKWTAYVEECCSILESNSDSCYKSVACFSRLTRELEKVHHVVHSPDCSLSNQRVSTYTMSELVTRLAVIKASLTKDNHTLLAYYYSIEAYLYQPSSEDLQVRSVGSNCTEELTTKTLNTISSCTTSCLKAMDEFNSLSDEEITALPLFHFSRVIYTAGILMRLRYFILSLPSNIEKDLVPRYAIVSVSKLHERVNTISTLYPTNFLMKKMRLVLRLFVQTYVTQVNELLSQTNDGSSAVIATHMPKGDYKNLNKLANAFMNSAPAPQMAPAYSHGLHLDLLSYAATEHRRTNGAPPAKHRDSEIEKTVLTNDLPGPQNATKSENGIQAGDMSMPPPSAALVQSIENPIDNMGSYPQNHIPSQYSNGDTPMAAPASNQVFSTIKQPGVAGPLDSMNGPMKDNKDVYEFDDEFWSNLLTTNSDKYLFAPDVPSGNENVLYNIFN